MSRARAALSFAFLERYAGLAIALGATVITARLLTPAQIGAWSVAAAVLAYASMLRDFGAGQYLVQAKQLDHEQIAAVWTLQLGSGCLLAGATAVLAAPLAAFYREPVLADLLLIAAVGYALNPFGSLTQAALARDLRFDLLAGIRLTAALGGAAVAITLAWRGHGAASLAWGALAGSLVNAILCAPFRPRGWPWLPRARGLARVFGFGSSLTVGAVMMTLVTTAPELLLGRTHGMSAAGLYSRAAGLIALFNRLITDAVGGVATSWLAEQRRAERSLAPPFLRATACVCALGWSFAGVAALLAHPLLITLFGPQWGASAGPARVLALGALLAMPAAMTGPALIASGAAGAMLRASALSAAETLALLALAAPHGALAMAGAAALGGGIGACLWLRAAHRQIGFSAAALWSSLRPSALAATAATLGALPAVAWFGNEPAQPAVALAAGCAGAAAGLVSGLIATGHPLWEEVRRIAGHVPPAPDPPHPNRETERR
jgi:O-antigen/teichoic acid export membrane protein